MFGINSITVPRFLWVLLLCAAAATAVAGFVIAYVVGGHIGYYNEFADTGSASMVTQMAAAVAAYPAAFITSGILVALSVLAAIGSAYSIRVNRALALRTKTANACAALHIAPELAVAR